jgi:hypothetical protein
MSANRAKYGASIATDLHIRIDQLEKLAKTKLDSCDRNLVNTKKADTLGNQLCDQVRLFCCLVLFVTFKKLQSVAAWISDSSCPPPPQSN